ncbi:MAG TPA: efflux RND transporter periplasmic adaptor subunit [Opitutaceae bacterium]
MPEYTDSGGQLPGLEKLGQLRRFAGPAAVFWQNYLDALVALIDANYGLLVRRRTADEPGWRRIAASPSGPTNPPEARRFMTHVEALATAAVVDGTALRDTHTADEEGLVDQGIAVRIDTDRSDDSWVAVLYLPRCTRQTADDALKRLRVAACIPAYYQDARSGAKPDAGPGARDPSTVLDLLVLLDSHKKFVAMSMAFCNELATRHQCERVALGWEERGYVRVKAISHTEKFVEKMEAVQVLEAAMEEALDQDEEIYWPPLDGETLITRDHGKYGVKQAVKHLCSVPLRIDGAAVAVVTLERESASFEDAELRMLRICADVAAPRLAELRKRDRWFGARWTGALREKAAGLLGPEHTWAKVGAILGAVALFVLFVPKFSYRVESPFILRTDDVSFLSAAFDGFLSSVDAKIGSTVPAGGRLLTLDTRDLLLEEAASLADSDRYAREEEKARAERQLAEMRIAEAQLRQAQAKLQLIRHRLAKAEIVSPFDAIVIEGDLLKRIGSPVRQGDLLFKIARLDKLYIEARVDERDIHELKLGAAGEMAFASSPKEKFTIQVVLIEPVAKTAEKGNAFIVRLETTGGVQDWWRPGMSGICKVEADERTLFWIIFHRTIDFLRMFLWW